ncbi:MAG: hypothetical protein OEV31_02975, partial [Gammaproteobacteria bacterium]|nr:hypothetical protein [Gammaproteobacteria bacterium]
MPNNKNRIATGLLLITLALLAGCGGGGGGAAPPALLSIKVAPANPTLKLGRSLQMTATGYYSYG